MSPPLGHCTLSPTLHVLGDGVGRGDGCGLGPDPVQSDVLPFGQSWKLKLAEGHVVPSGQHSLPAHATPPAGHCTVSPTSHAFGDGCGDGCGDGTGCGDGCGDGPDPVGQSNVHV